MEQDREATRKHDALAVDDFPPLGERWRRQLGQRRKLGGHQDSSFRRAPDLAFRCLSAILFGMRSISGKRVEG